MREAQKCVRICTLGIFMRWPPQSVRVRTANSSVRHNHESGMIIRGAKQCVRICTVGLSMTGGHIEARAYTRLVPP
eukprot:383172-Pelagomonas_calceolata.AAC.5